MNKLKIKRAWSKAIALSLIMTSIAWSSSVYALGMGSAIAESYIGERLSVHIPLFNVKEPDELSVLIQRIGAAVGGLPLDAKIERKNSQLGVRITSNALTTEPYITFVVEVIDGGSSYSKEFTVLLDLVRSRAKSSSQQQVPARTTSSVSNSNVANSQNGGVMGPYDWAQANQVAETFGPVLDGQSLWRVARRINKALDVSVDQMMWSLYEANREQFSTGSITSLKAGSFLKIPSAEQASRISELQAKRNVERASTSSYSGSNNNRSQSNLNSSDSVGSKSDVGAIQEVSSASAQESKPFDLTGIDLSVDSTARSSGSVDGKAQEIIGSLAESVGNLTQELIKKDQRIAFLEEKVAALEKYAQVSAEELALSQKELSATSDISGAPALAAQPESTKENAQANLSVVSSPTKSADAPFEFKWWHWLLMLLGLLVAVILIFRERIIALIQSLRLFGDDNEIEFDRSVYDQDEAEFEKAVLSTVDPDLTVENRPQGSGLSQKSILDAIKNAVQVDDPLSPQTLMDLDGEYSYTEAFPDIEFENQNEANLSFLERYNMAMEKLDYGFALQLLNMARNSEIDQATYHYHRLSMYEVMQNEDEFYDYFCEIENEIPSFPSEVQTKISQLVLQMAQH